MNAYKPKVIQMSNSNNKNKTRIIMDNRVNIVKIIADLEKKPSTVIYKHITQTIKVKKLISL